MGKRSRLLIKFLEILVMSRNQKTVLPCDKKGKKKRFCVIFVVCGTLVFWDTYRLAIGLSF